MAGNSSLNMIDVSCIIINYNTAGYTVDAIKSIVELHDSQLSYEIVVIDNASSKVDFDVLREGLEPMLKSDNAPPIKLFRSKQNIGFGAGNMLGVQHSAPCNFYAFINNDTLQISQNCLFHLKQFMDETEDAAVCSPQMLDDNRNFRVTIDHFSTLQREILRRPLLEFLFPKTYLNRKRTYDHPKRVQYVQGSFMFVNAQDFNEIGGFDTNLFLYYEESDLSRRLLKRKMKYTYLIPDLEYIHYKSQSTSKNIRIKIEQKISLLYYIRKHFGYIQHKILIVYFIVRYFFTSFVKPKYFPLFLVLLKGAHITESLKLDQKIKE